MAPKVAEKPFFTTKYCKVEIFNGNNFLKWHTNVQVALSNCHTLGITQGRIVLAPAPPVVLIAAYRIWQAEETLFNKRLDDGITIIGGSINELYQEEVMAEINARDLLIIWNKIITFNNAKDLI